MNKFYKLFSYIKTHKYILEDKGRVIEYEDTNFGDFNYQEESRGFLFKIGKDNYRVCSVKVTEDNEDWGQAEAYTCDICEKNEQHIDPLDVLYLLENFQAIKRNNIINEILEACQPLEKNL